MRIKQLRNQTGMVGLEVGLIIVVLVLVGFVGYRYYKAHHTTSSSSTSSVNTTADGNVTHTSNALIQDAAKDSAANQKDSSSDTATSSSAAQGMGSTYNENSF